MKKIKFFSLLFIFSFCLFYSCNSTPKTDDLLPENKETENQIENPENDEVIPSDNTKKIDNSVEITKEPVKLSRTILGTGIQTAQQLADFFLSQNPDFTFDYIEYFAGLYIAEAAAENINSDVAFAQMCLETGFLRFGGLVQPEWHNYCGLGAMDAEHPGCVFETEQLGIRAHIQHLQAYATTEDVSLNNDLVDPRYNWVHKTKFIEDISGLTGTWATDPIYAEKLENILQRMEDLLNK